MLAAGFAGEDVILAEDRLRADQYQLLAGFLAAPPEAGLLQVASAFAGDDTEYGRALAELADRAGRTTPAAASREYHDLFIGIGRGELIPYASYYRTGFLNEKPLAQLRGDMARLGIARAETVKEPEDHISALCEMMAGLITGAFGAPLDLAAQRTLLRQPSGAVGAAVLRRSGEGEVGVALRAARNAWPHFHGHREDRLHDGDLRRVRDQPAARIATMGASTTERVMR